MNAQKPLLTPRQVLDKLTHAEKDSIVAQVLFVASEDMRAGAGPHPTQRRLADILTHGKKTWREHSS